MFAHACRLVVFAACLLLATRTTLAQGTILIDDPAPDERVRTLLTPFELKMQRVDVEITDGVAVTTIEQTFFNPLGRPIEGIYVFPLPEGAAVGGLKMTAGGKTLHGEVLDADQARRTYEGIVRQARDPALLELLVGQLYRARVFPIPPRETVNISLTCTQTLHESGGLGQYRLALARAGARPQPIEQLAIYVRIRSANPLATVFCPSHPAELVRDGPHAARLSHEQRNATPDRDFVVCFQQSSDACAISVLTHALPGEPGYFMLRVAPRGDLRRDEIQAKDIAFVVDTSGSMRGEKIAQLRRALRHCILGLDPRDRFNIFAFSTAVRPFADGFAPVDEDQRAAALRFADGLEAVGGTNISQALAMAIDQAPAGGERPYLIVFMTDGQPTVELIDPEHILKMLAQKDTVRAAGQTVRIHVLGVGSDVNTHLLDRLAQQHHGSRDYCTEQEDLELKLSGLAGRLSSPVLTALKLDFGGLAVRELYPRELPDLFHGDDLVVLGRYEGGGGHTVTLTGRFLDKTQAFENRVEFAERSGGNEFLPRLWANRKVAYLLDQIRLNGESRELKDEIVRLATRHGIVTPYTAALILEDSPTRPFARLPHAHAVRRIAADAPAAWSAGSLRGGRGGGAPIDGVGPTGADAVRASREMSEGAAMDHLAADDHETAHRDGPVLRRVGGKTFFRDDQHWVDSAWDSKTEPRRVTAFSDEYFELLRTRPGLARYVAIAERVVVEMEGVVYEVLPAE